LSRATSSFTSFAGTFVGLTTITIGVDPMTAIGVMSAIGSKGTDL
jgi:hypothetical protein